MDLKDLINPLRRWWWLLVAATTVAAVSSFVVAYQQPPVYQSRSTLMVGRTMSDPNPTGGEFYLNQQLASIYAEIGQRQPVVNDTKDALGLEELPEFNVRALPNSQLIEIRVNHTVPAWAQAVAATLANQLILQSPTAPQQEEQARQAFASEQLDYLEEKIPETQAEIATEQRELAGMVSARQIADSKQTIAALQDKLVTLQSNYAALLASTQQGAANTLSIIEPASLPTKPIGPNLALITMLAGSIGLVLASGGAYLLEYLDDTVKTSADAARELDVPVLSQIRQVKHPKNGRPEQVYVVERPHSPEAEAFRSLKANLELAIGGDKLGSVLVTSPGPQEGKTTVAVNLAAAMAQSGMKVVLLDADLRRSSVHRFLGIPNQVGLTDVLHDLQGFEKAQQIWRRDNLAVITSGRSTSDGEELLISEAMARLLWELEGLYDAVVINGSPFLMAHTLTLASRVKSVLVVVSSRQTRVPAARAMMEQLRRGGAHVIGAVLNRAPQGSDPYGYYSYYFGSGGEDGRGKTAPARVQARLKPEEKRH